jgi:hypothetical protein
MMKVPFSRRRSEAEFKAVEELADKQLDILFDTAFTLLDDLQGTTVKVRKQLEITKKVSRQYAAFKKDSDGEATP